MHLLLFLSFTLSQLLCSFWWMTLSHRLQRSVYSLGIPQPRWINGRWECSNRALGSIHQTDRRCWERNTPPVFVLESVQMFVCASLCVCGFVYLCVLGCQHQCISVFFVCVLQVKTPLTQTNQKPRLLLMPTFPRQRLPSRDGKSLPLCFSAFTPSIPSILSIQSAAVAVCGIN